MGRGFGVDFAGAHDETGGGGPAVEEFADLILERGEDGGFGGAEAVGIVIAEKSGGLALHDGVGEEECVGVEKGLHAGGGGELELVVDGGFDVGGLADVHCAGGCDSAAHGECGCRRVGGGDCGEGVGDDDRLIAHRTGRRDRGSEFERQLAVIVVDHVDEHGDFRVWVGPRKGSYDSFSEMATWWDGT